MSTKTNLKNGLVVLLFLLAIVSAASAKTIYVDADAPGSDNGTNWTNAYNDLQDALADAVASLKPVEIRVAQGTYEPDAGSDRTKSFALISEVTLKGGYAGYGEADPNARDITAYKTILSGDLNGNDVPVADPCDLLDEPTRSENSYHVVLGYDVNEPAGLDGFTVTGGNANAGPHWSGGGLVTKVPAYPDPKGNPTVSNCTFVDNSATSGGGGMWRYDDAGRIAKIQNCTFSNNYAKASGGAISAELLELVNCVFSGNSAKNRGGALDVKNMPLIDNCTFSNNSADEAGGMYVYGDYSQIITNCTFSNNSANSASLGYGGGLWIFGDVSTTVINCKFLNNYAKLRGGGIYIQNFIGSSEEITNCLFSGNSAGIDGGGLGCIHGYITFTNCTFSENDAGGDGGGFCGYTNEGVADFNNCVLWGNTADNNGPQIALKTAAAGWIANVNYSDVQGGQSDVYVETNCTLNWGSGNITNDPLFVDANGPDNIAGTADDDLHVLENSNCIDAGDNTIVPADTTDLDGDLNTAELVPYDLDGNPRFVDDPVKTDTGNGTAPIVDMGAYEARRYIYVDTDAAGNNDGTSWTDAYNYLQDGLAAATSSWGEILVAEGTYKPDQGADVTSGDRSATFQLKSGIDVNGGYAGYGQPNPNIRDAALYECVLSGDLNGNDVPVSDPCDLENEPTRDENSYHVVTGADSATINGFTITAGNADGSDPNDRGGGMYNKDSSPTVGNCKFNGNWAGSGGGIYDYNSSPIVTGSLFTSNASNNGGGMYNYGSIPVLTNCTFGGNQAKSNGGGMYNRQSIHPLTNCILWGNTDSSGSGESSQVYLYFGIDPPDVNYTCIQGWTGTWGGTGNIGTDPCFVDAGNDDYHIGVNSSCADAGDPSGDYTGQKDIDGNPRVVGPAVDIGADEEFPNCHPDYTEWVTVGRPNSWFLPRQCHGDADGLQEGAIIKKWVSFNDLNIFVAQWQSNELDADFDHAEEGAIIKKRVSFNDLNVFVANWQTNPDPNCLDCP